MEASRAVSQVRVVAIWRPSVEWQRGGVEVSWVRVVSFGKPSVEWRHGWTSGLMSATGHGLDRVDAWSNGCDRCL